MATLEEKKKEDLVLVIHPIVIKWLTKEFDMDFLDMENLSPLIADAIIAQHQKEHQNCDKGNG